MICYITAKHITTQQLTHGKAPRFSDSVFQVVSSQKHRLLSQQAMEIFVTVNRAQRNADTSQPPTQSEAQIESEQQN